MLTMRVSPRRTITLRRCYSRTDLSVHVGPKPRDDQVARYSGADRLTILDRLFTERFGKTGRVVNTRSRVGGW